MNDLIYFSVMKNVSSELQVKYLEMQYLEAWHKGI